MPGQIWKVYGRDTFAREDYLIGQFATEEEARECLRAAQARNAQTQDEALRDTVWIEPPAATGEGQAESPAATAPDSPDLNSLYEDLWYEFQSELWADAGWDSEFTPSPHHPSVPLQEFVNRAGAAGVPFLAEALTSKDRSLVYWACVGLRWLGPVAGEAGFDALEAHIRAAGQTDWEVAVAMEAIDPARAHTLGIHRQPGVMSHIVEFYLARGMEAACDFIAWVLDHEDAQTVEAALSSWQFRDAVIKRCPLRLTMRLEQLTQSASSEAVRKVAGRLLGEARTTGSASELILTLSRTGGVSTIAIERLASHPDSELLIKPLVESGNLYLLADLLMRRRCAGWRTDPAPLRPLLREKLERPKREWRYEEHEVHYAALCVAELGDVALIDSLVRAVIPGNTGFAWEPLTRAFWSLGFPAQEALRQEMAACPPGERRTRLEWMQDALERSSRGMRDALDSADATYLRGRIEPSVWGAFRAYADVLLMGPSAHAAFQIAWIDRAFGAEIVPERVRWIRELGFRDEAFLAELATPAANPLHGLRFTWDGGETANEPGKAPLALAAGLPSLAAHWAHKVEEYKHAAEEHMARVRRATTG